VKKESFCKRRRREGSGGQGEEEEEEEEIEIVNDSKLIVRIYIIFNHLSSRSLSLYTYIQV
jgi:hypothetical protein